MKKKNDGKILTVMVFLITTLLIGGVFVNASGGENKQNLDEKRIVIFDQSDDTVTVTIPIGEYKIKNTEQGAEISIEDFGSLLVPGKPNLPSRIFAIAIPPGAELSDVTFDTGDGVLIPGSHQIPPVPLPRVIGEENQRIYEQDQKTYDENFGSVYGINDQYPENMGEFVRTAGYRKYNLVDVRVTPFTYRPQSGQLMYYPEITVEVTYMFPEEGMEIMVDSLVKTERIADEIIANYDQAKGWYPERSPVGLGLHDYVIITLDSLIDSVTPLAEWENYKGRNVEVVTITWIDKNYDGYDLPEKIRNFLMEKMTSEEWGIDDVLLVGDYDDVPMRLCWQDLGYGKPETDLYYAELSLPDSESWDADGDQRYGENSDPIDFYSEVNVGRIPWSDPDTVLHICEKSAAYEQNDDPSFKKNILLLGAFFWDDDPTPRTDNAVLMEYKVDADFHPWMSDWTMTRMYEEGYSTYPMDYDLTFNNVKSVWSSGKFAFVNWAGHGSPWSSHIYHGTGEAFAATDTCPYLNDDYPSIIFADACSNSDTDYVNVGQAMLKQGAVGFLGATKVALGMPGWDHPNDGSGQSLDYYFTTAVTSGDYTQGEAHQWALREMYTKGLWSSRRYEMFEWGALWGNPDLGMADLGDFPVIEIGDMTSGIGTVKTIISNIGSADGTDISWSISVNGGILGFIDATTEGTIDTLSIDNSVEIQTNGMLFGLGQIEIIVKAYSRVKKEQGFIFGPIIILTQ